MLGLLSINSVIYRLLIVPQEPLSSVKIKTPSDIIRVMWIQLGASKAMCVSDA